MKIKEQSSIRVKLNGSDASDFKSIMKKLNEEEARAGFKSSLFNDNEKELIKNINEKM